MADLVLEDHNQGLQINLELMEKVPSVRTFSLLPGLSDDLTIDHIFTKVSSWRTLCSLSTTNKAWHEVISKRKIHDTRVRTNSTQTLVVIIHEEYLPSPELPEVRICKRDLDTIEELDDSSPVHFPLAISLYDPGRDAWSHLPHIPGIAEGIPHESECVCSNGKVYILGGLGNTKHPMKEVYMLDLGAGHGTWIQRESMQRERARFSCHVNDGKIFAFGGTSIDQEVLAKCEVFDIEQNVWSSLPSMPHRRTDHKVALSEGKFYVHGGLFWQESIYDPEEVEDLEQPPHLHDARFAEVFDLYTNQWTILHNFKRGMQGPVLEVDGKLLNLSMSINHNSVEIYAGHENSWISSQPIAWNISEPGVPGRCPLDGPCMSCIRPLGSSMKFWLGFSRCSTLRNGKGITFSKAMDWARALVLNGKKWPVPINSLSRFCACVASIYDNPTKTIKISATQSGSLGVNSKVQHSAEFLTLATTLPRPVI